MATRHPLDCLDAMRARKKAATERHALDLRVGLRAIRLELGKGLIEASGELGATRLGEIERGKMEPLTRRELVVVLRALASEVCLAEHRERGRHEWYKCDGFERCRACGEVR